MEKPKENCKTKKKNKFDFLKPIAKEISKMKLEKFGADDKKILKYKAVIFFKKTYKLFNFFKKKDRGYRR